MRREHQPHDANRCIFRPQSGAEICGKIIAWYNISHLCYYHSKITWRTKNHENKIQAGLSGMERIFVCSGARIRESQAYVSPKLRIN